MEIAYNTDNYRLYEIDANGEDEGDGDDVDDVYADGGDDGGPGFSTDINDYSIIELLELLELSNNPNKSEIINKIRFVSSRFKSSEIVDFFNQVETKILSAYDNIEIEGYPIQDVHGDGNNNDIIGIDNDDCSNMPFDIVNSLDILNNIDNLGEKITLNTGETDEYDSLNLNRNTVDIDTTIDNINTKSVEKTYIFNDVSLAQINSTNTILRYSPENTIQNVSKLQLSSILFTKPYTFSLYNGNTRFYITDGSGGTGNRFLVELPDDIKYLMNRDDLITVVSIMNSYFLDFSGSPGADRFLSYIKIRIIEGTGIDRLEFSLNSGASVISNDFSIIFDHDDFRQCHIISGIGNSNSNSNSNNNGNSNGNSIKDTPKYLGTILGFGNGNTSAIYSGSINLPIRGGKQVQYDTGELYISLNDNTLNFVEQYTIMNLNFTDNNIIAYVNKDDIDMVGAREYNKNFTTITIDEPIREYNGHINLLYFEIKILDTNGALQQIPIEDNNNFHIKLAITRSIAV